MRRVLTVSFASLLLAGVWSAGALGMPREEITVPPHKGCGPGGTGIPFELIVDPPCATFDED